VAAAPNARFGRSEERAGVKGEVKSGEAVRWWMCRERMEGFE
jgi:hypothetical protein